jgi:hypothetical protein
MEDHSSAGYAQSVFRISRRTQVFFASQNSPELQKFFPSPGWGIFYA